jgi:predicted AlkP superfamily pyrophosphatase or phosphodiesterase
MGSEWKPGTVWKGKMTINTIFDQFRNRHARVGPFVSALETMACKKPVVLFDLPFAREFMKDMYNGLMAKPMDVEDLSNKIGLLLSDRKLALKLGQNAFQYVKKTMIGIFSLINIYKFMMMSSNHRRDSVMKKLLIFFLDGFGYNYLNKITFLNDICEQKSPLSTLLSYSSGILPSIWSGTYPDENGIWTEFYYSPRKMDKSLQPFRFIPDGRIKNLLKYGFWDFSQRLGFEKGTLPGIPENIEHFFKRNQINYSTFPPVSLRGITTFDKILVSSNITYRFEFFKDLPRKSSLLRTISTWKKDTDVFIYSVGLCDSLGHKYGPNPLQFRENIEKLEAIITEAYRLLAKEDEASLVVFSDHGMTQTEKSLDLEERLLEFRLGQDFLVFLDSTIARFWFFKENIKDRITSLLENCTQGSILSCNELERYGLNFKDNRYGDLIFVARPGTVIFPSFMSRPLLHQQLTAFGMHGYAPEDPSTRGIFMCHSDVNLELGKTTHVTQILHLLLKIIGQLS